jgi:cell division protein FtsN
VTRVRVGPFGSKADAAQTAKKIRALKLDAVVIKH